MDNSKLVKVVGALAGAAIAVGGIVLATGLGGDAQAADPVKGISLATKQALVAEPVGKLAAAQALADCAQAERDARAVYEAADAAISDPAAPAVGSVAHDALLAARFAARADWAAAGVAANDAARTLQESEDVRKGAELTFDRAVCGATKTPAPNVAAYCANIAEQAQAQALVEAPVP